MEDENNIQTTVNTDDLKTELEQATPTQQPTGKTKEENFDGVVKKLNAKEKEIKLLKAQLREAQEAPKQQQDLSEIESLKKQVSDLVASQKKQLLSQQLDNVGVESKYHKAAEALLSDIAVENDLDLDTNDGLAKATKILSTEYPLMVNKKQSIGVPSGMTGSGNSGLLKALEGDGSDYFKLTPEDRKKLHEQVYKK